MTYRNSWDYICDICDTTPESAKPTYIENFLDMPEYVEKLNSLLSLVPLNLEHAELGQAWKDIASFQTAITGFYESEFNEYSSALNDLVVDLVSKTRLQRDAIESEVSRRGLRYAFQDLNEWEPSCLNQCC